MLLGLGFWQLDRAAQKTEMYARYADRAGTSSIAIGANIESPLELEFRTVRAMGTWDPAREFLLDNRIRQGQPGFHVITPLVFRGEQSAVLVNRGWIPGVPDRSKLPSYASVQGQSVVTGRAIVPPNNPFVLQDEPTIQSNSWPKIWQTLDMERFANAAPYQLQGVVILLDDAHSNGFARQWPPPDTSWIARHKAYAFQWFALSVTLLVIYFLLTFRPHRK